jgi:hypothetical protein
MRPARFAIRPQDRELIEENDAEDEDCSANPEWKQSLIPQTIGADCQRQKTEAVSGDGVRP